jgi:hypothetical protein
MAIGAGAYLRYEFDEKLDLGLVRWKTASKSTQVDIIMNEIANFAFFLAITAMLCYFTWVATSLFVVAAYVSSRMVQRPPHFRRRAVVRYYRAWFMKHLRYHIRDGLSPDTKVPE